ncbi:hypothetical protein ACFBZI_11055 [Moraxella sp. ZJ142]|uniref:hypothetical protein n=1 Tax=Moraxella marmotae TaxID=3344520 RepID=UPI0035D49617
MDLTDERDGSSTTDAVLKINEQIAHKKKLLDVVKSIKSKLDYRKEQTKDKCIKGGLGIFSGFFFFALLALYFTESESLFWNSVCSGAAVGLFLAVLGHLEQKLFESSLLSDEDVKPLLDIGEQYSDHALIKKLKIGQICYDDLRVVATFLEYEIIGLEYDLIALKKQAIDEIHDRCNI